MRPAESSISPLYSANTVVETALACSSLGIPVLPCNARNKVPFCEGGFRNASADERQIMAWWTEFPGATLGIPLGPLSGLCCLDLDYRPGVDGESLPKNGVASFQALCARLGVPLPVTHMIGRSPSGGLHLFFKWDARCHFGRIIGKLGEGIDLLGNGGYVIISPSVSNAGQYRWEEMGEPSELPEWLLREAEKTAPTPIRCTVQQGPGGAVISESTGSLDRLPSLWPQELKDIVTRGVPKGQRNTGLVYVCTQLRDLRYTPEAARKYIDGYCERCQPPHDNQKEVEAAIRSIWASAPRELPGVPGAAPLQNNGSWITKPEPGWTKPFFDPHAAIWSVDQILAYTPDPESAILLPRYLYDGGLTAMIGQGGVGKSRISLTLASAQVRGRQWLGFDTGQKPRNWLFLGSENDVNRWKDDLTRHLNGLPESERQPVRKHLKFQIEDMSGRFLKDHLENITAAVETFEAEIVVMDPLSDFAGDYDLNKGDEMKATIVGARSAVLKGNPKTAVLILHHARTGKANILQVAGWDAANFASDSKVLHRTSRCVINIAPGDEHDDTRLVITCAKANDCARFKPFGALYKHPDCSYEIDPDFDLNDWKDKVRGIEPGSRKQFVVNDILAVLGTDHPTTQEWRNRAMTDSGMSPATFDRLFQEAKDTHRVRPVSRRKGDHWNCMRWERILTEADQPVLGLS